MDEPIGAMVNHVSRFDHAARANGGALRSHLTGSRSATDDNIPARLWSAINRSPAATLASLIALYLAIACGQAATKLLWCDELITLAIARQGSFAAIWRALAGGADPNPPFTHWLVLRSTSAFGQGALAVRLPAILCVLLAIVCLWAILRRWLCPGYAALGVLAFMATRGFDYAYDARSYAPLMGFSMASLTCWLVACDFPESGRRWPPQNGARLAALAGMASALALGLSSNYYGVLAFFPIALGEAVRTVRLRRLEPGTWLAMAAAATPLLAFRPLIQHNLAEFGPHAWNHPHTGMIFESYIVLVEGVFWPVLGLALYALWNRRRSAHPLDSSEAPPVSVTPRPYEAAALGVLLLYPILGFAVALAGHAMISARCVVPVCCGFGIAAALLGCRVFAASARAGVVLLSIAMFWVVARESACAFILVQQRTAFFILRDEIAALPARQPIVVADSLFVLPLAHYSSAEVRARIVFPIDFDAIHRFESDDSGEQNLWAGRYGIFPIRIVPYSPSLFAGTQPTVIARESGWLTHNLAYDGYTLSEFAPDSAWQDLGGVFTPLAHEDTRLLSATRPAANRKLSVGGD